MTAPILDKTILAQFTGSETWYRHSLNQRVLYTDGAKYVADHGGSCGAYWLLDEIALTQLSEPKVAAEGFQVWTLTVHADSTATLTCEDGNSQPVFSKALEYTDFQQDGITLWFTDNTVFLPSEY